MSRMSVKEAAIILGITPRAVRLRIEEKRISATMMDGKWFVDVESSIPPSPEGRQEVPPMEPTFTNDPMSAKEAPPSIPPSPEGRQEVAVPAQFRLIMDQWVNPLVGQIRQQAEEIGDLRAKLEESERQRIALAEIVEHETFLRDDGDEEPHGFWAVSTATIRGQSGSPDLAERGGLMPDPCDAFYGAE